MMDLRDKFAKVRQFDEKEDEERRPVCAFRGRRPRRRRES